MVTKKGISDAVIISIIGGVVSIVCLFMTLTIRQNQKEIHQQINSRMDELLEINKEASRAKGNLEGREEKKSEDSLTKKK